MLIYQFVILAKDAADAHIWAVDHIDTEAFEIVDEKQSAFTDHQIVTVRSDPAIYPDRGYDRDAFEGSLNSEMRDPISDLRWWAVRSLAPV